MALLNITVGLTEKQQKKIETLARKKKVHRADIVREMIDKFDEKRGE